MVKSIYEQLRNKPGALHATLDQANHLRRLNSMLLRHLEPTLATHCVLANIRDNTVVLQADSPVWAAKLRYQSPMILDLLNASDITAELTQTRLTNTQLRVQPLYEPYLGPLLDNPHLSQNSAKFLKSVADATPDPRLKRVLSRLSRRSHLTE